jgi:acyl-CoA synthetase (AMP-forming)/AMP-acid ligase II
VFESVQVVTSGSAALDPQLQRRFEETYGVAVLPSYGATEFAGGVAGWTLALHREWGERKRGSAGRAQPGRLLRVVDEAGRPVRPGQQGLLEVGGSEGDWTRTSDLAHLDDNDFLWIDGRVDDAIIRGGFKVFPSEIVDVLRAHPDVLDAGAIGLPDDRLGSVPVAAVELRSPATTNVEELQEHLRAHLPAYKVPRSLLIVDTLPRTPSMKVSGPLVRALFQDRPASEG